MLTFIGNYIPSSTGVLEIELGGVTPDTGYDHINITGNANLNGTLNISLIDGFVPAPGDSFIILTTTGTVSDSFVTILKPTGVEIDVQINSDNVTVRVVSVTAIETSEIVYNIIPDNFKLNQNFPNPFNPTTTIRYGLPKAAKVQLSIYDMLGRKIVTLVNEIEQAGFHHVDWNGKTSNGSQVSSGTYIYQIETEAQVIQRKMLLMK